MLDHRPAGSYCLARKDKSLGYSPSNCHWRLAVTKSEVDTGIEDWEGDSGDPLVLTKEEQRQRKSVPKSQRSTFDVWVRMKRRSLESPTDALH